MNKSMKQGPALGHLVYDNYLPLGVVSSSKLIKSPLTMPLSIVSHRLVLIYHDLYIRLRRDLILSNPTSLV